MFFEKHLVTTKDSYKYKLIEKTGQLLKQMLGKAFFYDRYNTNKYKNSKNDTDVDEMIDNKFKLKTRKCPPQI